MKHQNLTHFKLAALAAVIGTAITVTACGGGSSSDASVSAANSAAYSGAVTGLGSIVVNGVRFDTAGADTADADDPTKPYERAMGLGITVSLVGTLDAANATGHATGIAVQGGVRGQVKAGSVNLTAKTMIVNGQTIQIDANTVFSGLSVGTTFDLTAIFNGLAASNLVFVEVYGVADANGTILATRVEEKTTASVTMMGHAIKGSVANLDTTGHTFDITLRSGVVAHVTYTDDIVVPAAAQLVAGAGVRVLVDSASATALNGATGTVNVTATKVLVKRNKLGDGVHSKLQGAVKTISTDGKTWTIGDATVDVSQSPTLEGLTSLSAVTVGTIVKVDGTFVNGVLVATSIETNNYDRQGPNGGVRLFGAVSAADAKAKTFTVQGVTVAMGANTVGSLPAVGTYVEVQAKPDATTGVLTAVRVVSPGTLGMPSRPFEMFGVALCTGGAPDLQTANFSMAVPPLGSLTVDGSTAAIKVAPFVDMSASTSGTMSCLIETRGTMVTTTVNNVTTSTLKATNIDVKLRATGTLPSIM